MTNETVATLTQERKRTRPRGKPVPAEGANGVFTESWFPVCPSKELPQGKLIGKPFLDGRIVIYRTDDGVARVFSAYCPHMGADLGAGTIVDNRIQCPFHRWEYNAEGWCEKTGLGDPAPKIACLYKFHVREKFGLIWIFNGAEPWWEIPDYPIPEEDITFMVDYDVPAVPLDPWIICANTPDWQHLRAVHRLHFDHNGMFGRIDWTDHSMEYDLNARLDNGNGPPLVGRVGIYGTSMFRMHGEFMGHKICTLTGFHMLAPGQTQVYYSLGTTKSNGTPEDDARVAQVHALLFQLGKSIVTDDRPILHSMKYTPGVMTGSDRALSKYLDMVRSFPRSHDSSDFIK